MAATRGGFLRSYPEFSPAGTDLLDAKLSEAALQVDATVWEDKTEIGVYLTAAHLLAQSPNGEFSRLQMKDGTTIYARRLDEMIHQVTSGFRLI